MACGHHWGLMTGARWIGDGASAGTFETGDIDGADPDGPVWRIRRGE